MKKENFLNDKNDVKEKNNNFTSKLTQEEEDQLYYDLWLREKREREYELLVNNKCNE